MLCSYFLTPFTTASINLILITCLLFLVFDVSLADVHFSYNSTSDWQDIQLSGGDAANENHILILSHRVKTCSWAIYKNRISLVDGNRHASFRSKFSFMVNYVTLSKDPSPPGDGLAFFITGYDSNDLQSNGNSYLQNSGGEGLCLYPKFGNTSQTNLVAVEFDTYHNPFDPDWPFHVGIDVNSIYSVAVQQLPDFDNINGTVIHAWVSYSATDHILNVSFNHYNDSELPGNTLLSYKINMLDALNLTDNTVSVGFSASTGNSVEINQILSWEFNTTFPETKPKYIPAVKLVAIFCPIGVVVLCFGGVSWFYMSQKKSLKKGGPHRKSPKKYRHKELQIATTNFAPRNILGEGGYGTVFKGYLRDSCDEVAVKNLKQGSFQGPKEFDAEVRILSKLRHTNLVELFGWCKDNGEHLLVYEYMPNGSLSSLLYDRNRLLLWHKRYVIACNLADVLCYLHIENECEKEVVHRDIKPDNVLLDSNLEAKLSDFGLARLVNPEISADATSVAGSMGYIAPEIFDGDYRPNSKSDIYSFGIVILEIACGRKPLIGSLPHLIEFVWEHYGRDDLLKAADPRLKGEYDAREMERVMYMGLWCSHPDPSQRPSIAEAKAALNFTIDDHQLPNLPRTRPAMRSLPNLDYDATATQVVLLDEQSIEMV